MRIKRGKTFTDQKNLHKIKKSKLKLNLFNSKRSQEIFGLSFGTIFSIVLVIFFIILAIIVVKSFLNMQNCSKIGIFVKELNSKIDNAWNSNDASFEYIGYLPSSLQYVCFLDFYKNFDKKNPEISRDSLAALDKKKNFFFYPAKKACGLAYHELLHIDISEITKDENPFCIKVLDGKSKMIIEKESDKPLVMVKRR